MEGLLKFGRSIREYENNSSHSVFNEAQTYPVFFERHLVHPARRLKIFIDDPNANIRAFYFQYLILLFEIENKNFDFYMEKLHSFILNPSFNFIFLQSDDENIFNDQQFKRFFLQFLEILQSGQFLTVEQALNKYPIADIVFVYFFRSLLIYAQITNDFEENIDKNILFGFLLQNFSIDAAVYEEKCLKFFEAEVFVYQQNPYQVYMAYIQIDNDMESLENSSNSRKSKSKKGSQIISENESIKTESINKKISILDDYKDQIMDQKFQEQGNFRKQKVKEDPEIHSYNSKLNRQSSHKAEKVDKQPFYVHEPEVERRIPSSPGFKQAQQLETTTYRTSRATTIHNKEHVPSVPTSTKNIKTVIEQPLIYEPKKTLGRQLRADSKPTESSFKKSLMKKLNVSKQFTDSRTLMKISEPYRSNIQKIKTRSRQYRDSLIRTLK